jgi:hypothetical protein
MKDLPRIILGRREIFLKGHVVKVSAIPPSTIIAVT